MNGKYLLSICILLVSHLSITAQVKIGDNPATINASSLLELESTDKGLLMPRMTAAQKNAISSPSTGLIVYQSDGSSGFYFYDGTAWTSLSPSISQSTQTLVRIFATTSGNSIPNATITTITFSSTDVNTVPSSWSQGTGIFTAPSAGIYKISAGLLYSSNAASMAEFNVTIIKNGSYLAASGNFDYTSGGNSIKAAGQVEAIVDMAAGDLISIAAYQNSGSTVSIHSNTKWSYVNIEELPSTATTATSTVTHYITGAATATVGDTKQGFQAADHGGWVKLDGRAISTLTGVQQTAAASLGFAGNLPDATDKVLMSRSSGILADTGGNSNVTIAQANLPNVTFTGTTDNAGDHEHLETWMPKIQSHGWTSSFGFAQVSGNASGWTSYIMTGEGGAAGVESGIRIQQAARNTSTNGDHNHSVNIPSGGSDTALDITPSYLQVNTFIYLGL